MKRTLAERVAFLMLSAALAVGAWAVTGRAACSVTAPYQFPVQPGTPEWVELSANARRAACRLPAGLAEQMTSEALLETALDYPFNASMYVSSDLEGMFGKRAALAGNGALAELVTRPDAEEVIARALAAPAEAGEDPLRRQGRTPCGGRGGPPAGRVSGDLLRLAAGAFRDGGRLRCHRGRPRPVRRPSRKAWMAVNSRAFS
ncbi:MAG: hypothetical protein ACLUHL_12965 [Dysosmobacter welbionis]